MCGVVAIAGAGATEPGRIEAGVNAIRHRGPDGQGVWRSPDGRAALGHARLAIIDLSDSGAQPMHSADRRGVLAYNGEVFNFRDIAGRVDTRLRSHSDTEVILELLRKYGADAVRLLRGMFAFAYWDGEELLLARDRLGVKPLFYADDGDRVVVASEIAAVLAARGAAHAVDGRAIDDYLTYLYVPPPRTGIVGVNELPPAHLLRWRPGRYAVAERYWEVPSHARPENGRPARVRELLDEAVRAHLVSDVPVGVFLSGGIDSSSIVALAAKHYPQRLKTFCVTFGEEGRHLDERRSARAVASRFGTDHRELAVQADVASIVPELVARFGQPFGNPTAVLTYALSRATREHVKVALAGDGGDELLGGYPRYQGVWLAEVVRRAPRLVRDGLARMLGRLTPKHAARGRPSDRLQRFLAHSDQPVEQMYFRWVSYLDDERKAQLLADRPALIGRDASRQAQQAYAFFVDILQRHPGVRMQDAACLLDLESFLPSNVLAYGDRMSMAHALEVRVPYADHVLVEELAPLPLALKMPGGVQKGLFRAAMRRDLPPTVLLHRKVGFNPPIGAWLRDGLGALVDDYLGERSVRQRGLLAWSAVQHLRAGLEQGHAESAHSLWSIVILEAWMRWLDRVSQVPFRGDRRPAHFEASSPEDLGSKRFS